MEVYLSEDLFIKELEVLEVGKLKYIFSEQRNYKNKLKYIIEIEREQEIIKTIIIHIKNKKVVDYEGCYFLNEIIIKFLRKNKVIVPNECLKEVIK